MAHKRRRPDSNRGWPICSQTPSDEKPGENEGSSGRASHYGQQSKGNSCDTNAALRLADQGVAGDRDADQMADDPELSLIASTWPHLDERERTAVLAVVRAAAVRLAGEGCLITPKGK